MAEEKEAQLLRNNEMNISSYKRKRNGMNKDKSLEDNRPYYTTGSSASGSYRSQGCFYLPLSFFFYQLFLLTFIRFATGNCYYYEGVPLAQQYQMYIRTLLFSYN